MKSIKLPFGLNKDNELVHVNDVDRGKECNCVCPDCGSPLIASKGDKNQHHFKHAIINDCQGGFESAIHLAAKKMIRGKKNITLPQCIAIASARDSKGKNHTEQKTVRKNAESISFDTVDEEIELHDMRADLLAKKENTPLIIEIFYRHKVDDQKIEKIKKANISAIEINLSNLTLEDVENWEALWRCINDVQRIQWLHNAKAHNIANSELKQKVARAIEEQESQYKQEGLKKQKEEQFESEKLLRALDNLKEVSSEKHITQLKQEAEMHPIWKANAPHLPFSWRSLPNYVNAYSSHCDWIFGCDRRIWQTAFYRNFIYNKIGNYFLVKEVDDCLRNIVGLKVPACVGIIGIYNRKYPQLIPTDIDATQLSSWKTLQIYFYHLRKLGILTLIDGEYQYPGSCCFEVISNTPTPPSGVKSTHHRVLQSSKKFKTYSVEGSSHNKDAFAPVLSSLVRK